MFYLKKILKKIFNLCRIPSLVKLFAKKAPPLKKGGINLVGYFNAPIGTSEVGRQCFLDTTKHSELAVKVISYELDSYEKQEITTNQDFAPWISEKYIYDTNIFFFNADSIEPFMNHYVPQKNESYNVGVFWWELEDYFYFDKGVNAPDEIFVFSDFIKQAIIKNYPNKIVTKFSLPYYLPNYKFDTTTTVRKRYGFSDDSFIFFFNFDFYSVYERKNPEGLVKAFAKAFKGNPNAILLLKTIHGNKHLSNFNKFQQLLSDYDIANQVVIIDKNMEKIELMNLLNASNCYVSLHRAEGLGIGMMEAMLLKKPVIATAYGGNMEFTNIETSLLVKYDIIQIGEGNEPYKKNYTWANPDIDDASSKMTEIYHNIELRNRLSENGYNYIISNHSNGKFSNELSTWLGKNKNIKK